MCLRHGSGEKADCWPMN